MRRLATAKPLRPGELSKRALFEILGYRPHPDQVRVHRSTAKRRLMACGVRFGKSTCAAMEALAALLEPGTDVRGWVVAPTYELANQIFRRTAAAVQAHLKHRLLELDLREQRLVVLNFGGGRSELRAKSADNAVSLLGEGLDFLIVDEAARLRREIWEEHLAQRLIDKDGWALLISTPAGPGWFYDLFRRGQRGRDPQCASWSSPSWANPHLDRAVIEAERERLSPDAFAQEFGGQFVGVESEPCDVCGAPSREAMGIVVVANREELPRCYACDGALDEEGKTVVRRMPNGDPLLVVIRGYEVPDDQRVLPEEGADGDLEVEDEEPPVVAS
jgi:hypothetical protein